MDGFLNIDKPVGKTSFDVIREIKPLLPRKTKLGHLGTLDPMAAGVLPLAIGQATRVIPFMGDEIKEYLATLTLGGISDTQDAWGNINYTGNIRFTYEQLADIIKLYQGNIEQIPPMYSAVHHQGKRLYELARQGISVERQVRRIKIELIEILHINTDSTLPEINLRVVCSRGTYIRTLCHDIGQDMGTGGFLSQLTRIRTGLFFLDQAISLEQIRAGREKVLELLLPIDYPLKHLPAVHLENDKELAAITNGNGIFHNYSTTTGRVRVYGPVGKLIAIADQISSSPDQTYIKPIRVFKP